MEKKLIKEAFRLQTLAGLNPINEAFGVDWPEEVQGNQWGNYDIVFVKSEEEEGSGYAIYDIILRGNGKEDQKIGGKYFGKTGTLEDFAKNFNISKDGTPSDDIEPPSNLSEVDECDGCQRSGYGGQPEQGERDFTRGHDHEGSMAMSELKSLQANSSRLINLIGDNAQLPGWVSSYISLAADYMNSVSDYLASEAEQMTDEY